ncbi:MAG: ATP-binding protein [Deltaproteobacteria bacterium]|nr:ATP-binding protein [Deltaproteobacteria bacterium]
MKYHQLYCKLPGVWISRDLVAFLQSTAKQRPAILLTGSRQAGKTSLLEHTFPDYGYVSLDLPALAEEADNSGEQFLARHPAPVIIDEVQYAPRLFRYLKNTIDRNRRAKGRYLLTGSQKFQLMQGISESLAGRVSITELHSLSLHEIEAFVRKPLDRNQIVDWMWKGGYPELVAENLPPRRFYSDYVATYLERDVRQALQVRNLRDFDRFLRLCALRTGQILSMNSLASETGVATNTIKSWLAVLEASGIVFLLPPYFRNLGKRLVKAPKLYFLDTGLACFLAGFDSPQALAGSGYLGAMFETLVLGQIVRRSANRGETPTVCFYRDHHGNEVDFVLPIGEKVRLIECKWSETPEPQTRGFREIESLVGPRDVLGKTIVTPNRGRRITDGTSIDDCVDLASLD